MRDANAAGRLHLKSKLLIGVAGLAAVASSAAAAADATPAAAPASDPKWLPYADIGGGVGDGFAQGKADLFIPVWQDMDSLMFVRLGIGTQTHESEVLNVGAGFRKKIMPDWILGLFAGVDNTQTDLGNSFSRLSLGAELMSADWDARINGYASKNKLAPVGGMYELYIHDTQIAILQAQEAAYSGFDGEVGYRVFHTDNTDVRLFAGGFIFHRGDANAESMGQGFDFKYPRLSGPRGRVEVNIFDLDVIGSQSRVSFDGEVSHDQVRGTSGYAGATLRIPLGAFSGQGAQALDDLDRRMADPVRRSDDVLTQWQFSKPEPVIIYNGHIASQPTNTLYYVSGHTAGAGTYADPTTLNDATARGPVNQFIVLTTQDGDVAASNAEVQTGETIVNGGQTFDVRGVDSHHVFTHDFAPGSGTPTIVPINPGDNILDVDSGDTIYGLHFGGPFGAAIYGHNVDQVNISGVNIDGTDGGQYGVLIKQDMSGDLDLHISNSSINGVGQDGVYVQSNLSDGGTSTENVEITNSSITGSGSSDVIMVSTISNGSTLTQNLTVDPTTLSGGEYAIFVGGYADGGSLTQNVTLSDVTVNDVTNSGIYVYAYGVDGANLTQHVTMTNVTVNGAFSGGEEDDAVHSDAITEGGYAYGNLITISAGAKTGAEVDQTFALTNIHASGALFDDILVAAYAGSAGTTHQYGTMSNVTANDSIYGDGVDVVAYGYGSGTVIQRADISHLNAADNYNYGVQANAIAFNEYGADSAITAQYVHVDHATLTGNYAGLDAEVEAAGNASALQDVYLGNSTLSGNFNGAVGSAFAADLGSAQQSIALVHDNLNGNSRDGADFRAEAEFQGFAAQTVYVAYSNFSSNGRDGMHVSGEAYLGGDVEQNVGVYHSTLSHNGRDGLQMDSVAYGYASAYDAYYYSHLTQNLGVEYSSLSHNGRDGVHIYNHAGYGGQLNQFVYLYNDTLDSNSRDGLFVQTKAVSPGYYGFGLGTAAYSDLYVVASHADNNGQFGIYVGSDAEATFDFDYLLGYTYLIQHVVVAYTSANHNGIGGFADAAYAEGLYSLNIQYVTLADSQFDSNGLFGAGFEAVQYYGPGSFGSAVQDVTIEDSDFSHNGSYGLAALADASGFQGRAEQHFVIDHSDFNYNGKNGIYLYRHAHDGVYYSYNYDGTNYAYPCTIAQGLTGGCAFVRQTVDISYSQIDHNAGDGIYVKTIADNYGAVYGSSGRPLGATLVLENTDVSHNGGDGLGIFNDIGRGSYLYQYVKAVGSHFDHNGGDGIYIGNIAHNGGVIGKEVTYTYQGEYGSYTYSYTLPGSKLTLSGSTASNNGESGIELYNYASSGSAIYQRLQFVNSHADNNHAYGIVSNSYASGGSLLLQTISLYTYVPEGADAPAIPSTTVDHNGYGGIHIYAGGYYADVVGTTLKLAGTDVSYNGGSGVYMGLYSYATKYAGQNFYASASRISHNAGFGAGLLDVSVYDGTSEQTIISAGNQFSYNDRLGLGAALLDYGSFTASQFLVSYYDTLIGNKQGGIVQYARFLRTNYATQTSFIGYDLIVGYVPSAPPAAVHNDINIDITYGDGIEIGMVASGPFTTGYAYQHVTGNQIYYSAANGIDISVHAHDGATIYNQTGVFDNYVYGAYGNGIQVSLIADSNGRVAAEYGYYGVDIAGNTVNEAGLGEYGGAGIAVVLADATPHGGNDGHIDAEGEYNPGYLMPIDIDGNTVSNVNGVGILVSTYNAGGLIALKTEIGYYAPNAVSYINGIGIAAINYSEFGLTVTETTIDNNIVTAASQAGIAVFNYNGTGTIHSYNTIAGNSVYGPSSAGIVAANLDGDGTLTSQTEISYNDVQGAGIGIAVSDAAAYSGYGPTKYGLTDNVQIAGNSIHDSSLGIALLDSGALQTDFVGGNFIYGDASSYGIAGYARDAAVQIINVYSGYKYGVAPNSQTGIPPSQQYYFYSDPSSVQVVF